MGVFLFHSFNRVPLLHQQVYMFEKVRYHVTFTFGLKESIAYCDEKRHEDFVMKRDMNRDNI